MRGFKHRVGLADPRGIPEKDFEAAPAFFGLLPLDPGEELVGVEALFVHFRAPPFPSPVYHKDR